MYVVCQEGERLARRGYWGDILVSPYISFGVECSEQRFFNKTNNMLTSVSLRMSAGYSCCVAGLTNNDDALFLCQGSEEVDMQSVCLLADVMFDDVHSAVSVQCLKFSVAVTVCRRVRTCHSTTCCQCCNESSLLFSLPPAPLHVRHITLSLLTFNSLSLTSATSPRQCSCCCRWVLLGPMMHQKSTRWRNVPSGTDSPGLSWTKSRAL